MQDDSRRHACRHDITTYNAKQKREYRARLEVQRRAARTPEQVHAEEEQHRVRHAGMSPAQKAAALKVKTDRQRAYREQRRAAKSPK